MKLEIFALSLALTLFLSCGARAKTLEFPENEPQFTVTFADDWKAETTSAGIISAQPKGAAYAISIFPVIATNASDAIDETMAEVRKRFQDVKPSQSTEFKTKNDIAYLERDYTANDKGSDRALAIIAFSPDGQKYYAIFQAGTPEVDKQYTQDVVAIVKSIKSLKAKFGESAE